MVANIAALMVALSCAAAPSDGLSQQAIEGAFNRIAPAIGVLRYSSEITNPNSGETSRRDTVTLALCVRPDGLMMAQGHMVMEDNEPFNVEVTLGEGDNEKEYEAEVLPKPEDLNVVFLKLKSDTPLNLPAVRFAPHGALGIGAPLFCVGLMGDQFDFARGVVTTRVVATVDTPRKYYALGLAGRFGNAGAPVVNEAGAVIGVVGFDLSRQEGGDLYVRSGQPLLYQSELFAKYIENPPVPVEKAAPNGEAWLGIFSQPLTDELAEYWGLKPEGGLVVSTVIPNSPAALSGMQPGDVITNFNGTPIRAKLDRDVLGFTKLVREAGPSSAVKIAYLRGGQPGEVTCQLTERPRSARDAAEFEDAVLGLTVREITTDVRIALNLAEDVQGVIVRRIKSGSPAQVGKMVPGVIVMAIGQEKVTTLAEFKAALEKMAQEKPAEVSIFARVGSTTGFFRVAPRWEK
jgi:serine protease Do